MRYFLCILGLLALLSNSAFSSLLYHEGDEDVPPSLMLGSFPLHSVVGTYLLPDIGSFESILSATQNNTSKVFSTLKMVNNVYRIHSVGGTKEWHEKFANNQLRLSFFKPLEEDTERLKPTYCVFVYEDGSNHCLARFAALLSRIK